MLRGINHAGVVVRDLEAAIGFYRDALGMRVLDRRERQGGPISRVVGYPEAHLRIADMAADSGPVLELIQYVSPAPAPRPTEERSVIGASHVCFEVDDVEEAYRRVLAAGGRAINPPVEVVPGKKGCYMQDPDGNWIELLQLG